MTSSKISFNEKTFLFRSFEKDDTQSLLKYLQNLSRESRMRFGPHQFSSEAITNLFYNSDNYRLYLAFDLENSFIEAYSIIKTGWLGFEESRYKSYGLLPTENDCTIAPSVSDFWQGKGLGTLFFNFIRKELSSTLNIKRYFLWGGVQASNNKALAYYKKNNFETLGEFEHNGKNIDMMLNVST